MSRLGLKEKKYKTPVKLKFIQTNKNLLWFSVETTNLLREASLRLPESWSFISSDDLMYTTKTNQRKNLVKIK